jgi:hypothetical protein
MAYTDRSNNYTCYDIPIILPQLPDPVAEEELDYQGDEGAHQRGIERRDISCVELDHVSITFAEPVVDIGGRATHLGQFEYVYEPDLEKTVSEDIGRA